jgi:periplasmic protein TonB
VSSGKRSLLALADSDRIRLAAVIVLAALLCPLLLVRVASGFAVSESVPPARQELDMRLVEIAPPVLAVAPGAREAAAQPAVPAAVKHAQGIRPRVAAPPGRPPHAEPMREHAMPQAATREDSAMADVRPSAPAAQNAPAAPVASSNTVATAPGGPAGSTPARVLAQPMPVLPDDLREQGYQVTAIAHFRIHADGSFDVDLVKPTQNPRLNQILLDTLHRWRFFPAVENGRPVDCDQDVRVHFLVS